MSRSRGTRAASVLLVLALGGILVAQIGILDRWQQERRAALAAVLEQAREIRVDPVASLPLPPELEPVSGLRERPLFVSGRRPVAAPAAVQPAQTGIEHMVLTSTIIAPEGRYALVRDNSSGRTLILAEGARYGNWLVESVHEERVELRSQVGPRTLKLRPDFGERGAVGARSAPAGEAAGAAGRTSDAPGRDMDLGTNRRVDPTRGGGATRLQGVPQQDEKGDAAGEPSRAVDRSDKRG